MTSKGGTKRPRHSGASLLRSGCAGLLVLALELWALEPGQEVLNPEAMALLGDQPGDGGGGVGHLEGRAKGAGEGRQLRRQQGPDALLKVGDGGWIEGGLVGGAGGPDRGTVRRRLWPGDGSRGRGVPRATTALHLITWRSVEGSRDRIGLGRAAP